MSSGHLDDEILRQLKIALRAGQSDVAEIGREERQLRPEIDILLAPEREPQHGPGVAQVVDAKTAAPTHASNTGNVKRLTKRLANGRGRVPTSGAVWEERRLRAADAEPVTYDALTLSKTAGQVRSHGDHA